MTSTYSTIGSVPESLFNFFKKQLIPPKITVTEKAHIINLMFEIIGFLFYI